MTFLNEMYKPDVLSCIANLSSDEVFTPPEVANDVLDILPQELFKSSKTKFLDPCCKSGVFLREIAKRLIEGLKDEFPDLEKRLDHIFKNQLYGLAITELTSLLSRRSVYCSKEATSEYCVVNFSEVQGNILYKRINHIWLNKKCIMCGASQEQYNRGDILETHAYQFIHMDEQRNKDDYKRLKEMKFDVIIGNPPYQLSDGGFGTSAAPIYHKFVNQAKKLNPRYITMIIPSRWFSGGKGLDDFRENMLNDNKLRVIHDFPEAADCFPGVQIKGGVCFFLWDRDNKGDCKVITNKGGRIISEMTRSLLENECHTFIRYNEAISILNKVKVLEEETMEKQISSRKPFGLSTTFRGENQPYTNCIKLYQNGGVGYVDTEELSDNLNVLDRYKVFIPPLGSGSDSFPHPILGRPFVGEPNTACTETYIVVGKYDTKEVAENVVKYLKTRFLRFLVLLLKNSQHATSKVYSFVPVQDFTQEWTDEKLYAKYKITDEEIEFIESMVRPME